MLNRIVSVWLFGISCVTLQAQQAGDYYQEISDWHEARISRLKAPLGWLSLAGLWWLKEGENTFGSAETCALRFPAGAPDLMGSFNFEEGRIVITTSGIRVWHDGQEIPSGSPLNVGQIYESGSYSWTILQRGTLTGIRLWDREHPAVASFDTIPYYRVHKKWYKKVRYEPYDTVRKITVPNVLGMQVVQECPGQFSFRVSGKRISLLALEETAERLLVVFSDQTSGMETYGGGRYLSVPKPAGPGRMRLDFNKAYNPPCAFTAYATCLLPVRENQLPVSIHAGEQDYGHH
jgi:uncharacterized protein